MNYQYFGLFLDEPTRNKLMQVIIGNPSFAIWCSKEEVLFI